MIPFKKWIQEYYNASFDFGVVDKVKVPDLPEGKYVLSWRWETLKAQSLADFLGILLTALGRRFCGWKSLQGFYHVNWVDKILSHLVNFGNLPSIILHLPMRIVR